MSGWKATEYLPAAATPLLYFAAVPFKGFVSWQKCPLTREDSGGQWDSTLTPCLQSGGTGILKRHSCLASRE